MSTSPASLRLRDAAAAARDFETVKRRLEAWLRRLDEQDPWFVLGVHPGATLEEARTRFRELASAHDSAHGGDPIQRRRILHAWDQVRVCLATGRRPRRALTPAPTQDAPQPGSRR